jgi:hypothetical protein
VVQIHSPRLISLTSNLQHTEKIEDILVVSKTVSCERLWRQSLETGEATEFGKLLEPAISPDNKQLAMGDLGTK